MVRFRLAIFIVSVVFVAAFLAACGGNSASTDKDAAAKAKPVLRVKAEPVQMRDVVYTVDAVGSLEAEDEVQVVAQVEGVIESVRFNEGDRVTKDSVLVTIDSDRYRLLAEQAAAAQRRAETEVRGVEADLARRERLFHASTPLVTAEELQHAHDDVERLKAAAVEAKAHRALADVDREHSIVRPLMAGTINRRFASTGQHVEPKTQLATLVDTRRLRLRFTVSAPESVKLAHGQEVSFGVAAFPGKKFTGRIYHISRTADPDSRKVWIAAWVENPDESLKPGFFAEVHAEVESHKNALMVPERAVIAGERGFVVFIVRDKVARERRVTLGLRTKDGAAEILNGLDKSDAVVVDGAAILRDGMTVEVVGGSL